MPHTRQICARDVATRRIWLANVARMPCLRRGWRGSDSTRRTGIIFPVCRGREINVVRCCPPVLHALAPKLPQLSPFLTGSCSPRMSDNSYSCCGIKSWALRCDIGRSFVIEMVPLCFGCNLVLVLWLGSYSGGVIYVHSLTAKLSRCIVPLPTKYRARTFAISH